MNKRTEEIAEEISILMPAIARRLLLEFFQQVNITQSQLLTIMALYEKAPCQLCELSVRMNVSAPTMTGLVDRLESGGYAKRIPDPEDRRVINVDLTPKGLNLAKKFRSVIKSKWEELLSQIPAKDREDYLRISKEIRNHLT